MDKEDFTVMVSILLSQSEKCIKYEACANCPGFIKQIAQASYFVHFTRLYILKVLLYLYNVAGSRPLFRMHYLNCFK